MAEKDVKKDIEALWTIVDMHSKITTDLETAQKKFDQQLKKLQQLEKTVKKNEAMIAVLNKRSKK